MSSFKPYPAYKASGIEWLGEIPEHWEVQSLKYILTERNEKNHPIRSKKRLSLSIGKGVTLYAEKTTNLDRLKDDFSQYKLAHKGDLVFNSMNMIVGAVGVSAYFGCVSPVYYTFFNDRNNSSTTKFYEYLFSCRALQRVLYVLGKGLIAIDRGDGKFNTVRLKVGRDDLRSMKLPFPFLKEQMAIAAFLNIKTKQIDEFIALKEKTIALLKERKTAIINQAVTKGLDPNVPMKDSGIAWLGEVPAHWEVKKLKYLFRIVKRIVGELGYDVLSITQNGIIVKDISSGEGQLSMDYSKYQLIEPGDYGMNHMDLLTGYVDISRYRGVISPDYRVFQRVSNNCEPEYFLKLFQMGYKNKVFFSFGQGSSQLGRWRLPTSAFKNFKVPLPSYDEQIKIIQFLSDSTKDYDSEIDQIRKEISLITEYRQSLISEAVTGKIDVRSWQPAAKENPKLETSL